MSTLQGGLLMALAMLGFAFEDLFFKLLTETLPVGEVLALVGLFGALCFALLTRLRGLRLDPRHLLIPSVMARNLGEIVTTVFYACAITFTPLAEASSIQQAAPLAVTLGAALFMGDQVGWRRWSAIIVGFIGVVVIVRPGADFSALSLLAVVSVFGLAMRDLVTRRIPGTISSLPLATYGFASLAPAGVILGLVRGETPIIPDPMHMVQLAGAVAFGVAGYYALVTSTRVADIAFVTPFRYTRILFAMVIGVIVFGESIDPPMIVGAALIVASGLYTLWRQAIRARAAKSQTGNRTAKG